MTPKEKSIRAKVPPRSLHIIVYECGTICSCRTRGEAELVRATHRCPCKVHHNARIVRYMRGSLYGRAAQTWVMPATQRQRPDQ